MLVGKSDRARLLTVIAATTVQVAKKTSTLAISG